MQGSKECIHEHEHAHHTMCVCVTEEDANHLDKCVFSMAMAITLHLSVPCFMPIIRAKPASPNCRLRMHRWKIYENTLHILMSFAGASSLDDFKSDDWDSPRIDTLVRSKVFRYVHAFSLFTCRRPIIHCTYYNRETLFRERVTTQGEFHFTLHWHAAQATVSISACTLATSRERWGLTCPSWPLRST